MGNADVEINLVVGHQQVLRGDLEEPADCRNGPTGMIHESGGDQEFDIPAINGCGPEHACEFGL